MSSKDNQKAWTDDHTHELLRAIVRITLQNRPTIYATSILQEVNNNGGDRINKKIQQLLKKLCESQVGSQDIVGEEVKKIGKSRNENTGTPSPKKQNGDKSD
uniref:Uncharacterized protein n=1 Tax=Kwoniella pini CBS 10737 TaxID=1296096 RepID=A0A1B9I338_9TREE|nr:uncharacterized protein I206_04446 [Kwoniella pini CBS 10737]OCF49915.1 hypothetical protein I206_04446 [Kwoniella pini CBS 10737]